MSNFERRLSAIHKRPSIGPGSGAGAVPADGANPPASSLAVDDGVGSLAWEAAERVSRILDVDPGTVISLAIAGPAGSTSLEVRWADDGLPIIREI